MSFSLRWIQQLLVLKQPLHRKPPSQDDDAAARVLYRQSLELQKVQRERESFLLAQRRFML